MGEKFWRYADFKAAGLINSRMTLKRAIDSGRLAPGRLITPNCRVWTDEEKQAFVKGGQVAPKTTRKADTSAPSPAAG
jgi:hypothetical protein